MKYETLKNIGLLVGGVLIGILINVYDKPNNDETFEMIETLPQQSHQPYQAEFKIIIENNSTKIDTIIKIQSYE